MREPSSATRGFEIVETPLVHRLRLAAVSSELTIFATRASS